MTALNDPLWARLSAERQNKLLEKNRYNDVEHFDWWQCTYEWFQKKMAERGVEITDIRFSGFYCQGDYAVFEGRVSDWHIVLRNLGHLPRLPLFGGIHEEWSFRSTCSRTYMSFSYDMPVNDNPYDEEEEPLRYQLFELSTVDEQMTADIQDSLAAMFNDAAGELFNDLQSEYEHLTSDENVVGRLVDCDSETLEAEYAKQLAEEEELMA